MILSHQQRQVLSLAALPNRQIATRLEISEKSVKKHFTRLYSKFLGKDSERVAKDGSRVKLLLLALRLGLVDVEQLAQFKTGAEWQVEKWRG